MRLHDLRPAPGSRPEARRVGRGIGSGQGKTAGRGHKGQKARSGGSIRRGFEGGQMPLVRRIPKIGFVSKFKRCPEIVNLDQLNRFPAGAEVTPEEMLRVGMVRSLRDGVKILGNGNLDKPLVVKAQAFSKSAAEKIAACGGRAEVMG
ncbi:MAG: 50S ribosomal protein L15 [Clostridia bacterium]|nr:MAG: 50S ribosomal protein L15 [Clostridia bacterium]